MATKRKSDDIHGNYPVLGYRVAREDRDEFLGDFEAILEILRAQPEYRRINLKKNAVFLRALELGLEHIRKRKSLG